MGFSASCDDLTARQQNSEGLNAVAETTLGVVRLAMDVVGDAACNRYKLCSWGDHGKPAASGEGFDDVLQAGSCLTG